MVQIRKKSENITDESPQATQMTSIAANKTKKMIAKTGMKISLGSLVVTGLAHFKGAKSLHIWSGVVLLAFSFWHHRLNKPKRKHKLI
jgi:hypothetical protein